MQNNNDMPSKPMSAFSRHCLALLALFLGLFSVEVSADVQLPHGEYYQNVTDLKVKVLGGQVSASRTWYEGRWYFNRAWEPLTLSYDALSGAVKTIERNGDLYEQDSATPGLYRFDVVFSIVHSDTGWQWRNRKGDWINYDPDGRVLGYGNRNDLQVSLQYDADGRRSAVVDHLGNTVLSYEYDPTSGQLRFVRDYTGRAVEYRYSGGQLSEVVDVLGYSWTYGYDSQRLTSHTDPEGRTTTIAYDATGRVASETGPDSLADGYSYDYDKTKREYYVRHTATDGRVTERWYDREGIENRRAVNGSDQSTVIYDGRNKIVTDRRGLKTAYERDEWDNVTKTIYPDGSSESTVYDYRFDLPTKKTDALGRVTEYEYDAKGNLLKMTEAAGTTLARVTEYSYDAYGQRKTQKRVGDTDTPDAITQYDYDDYGNLTAVTDPELHVTRYTHNVRGDVLTRTDANDHAWASTYNAKGWLLTQTDPENHTVAFGYDKVGNRISVKDARLSITEQTYDVRNRRKSSTDREGHASSYGYDSAGRLTAITDPLANVVKLGYDAEGRLLTQTDPAGNVITQVYDQGGGANGNTTYPGHLAGIQYPTFRQTYDYDARGRRVATINHLSDTEKQITRSSYDAVGNRISSTDAAGRVTQYKYDALARLIEIIDPKGQSTTFGYDLRNNLVSVTDPNGHTTRYEYDKVDRKTKELRPLGQAYSYAYDPAGNLTAMTDPVGRRTEYQYDKANRLVQQRHFAPATATPERTVDFGYDTNGNLISWSDGSYSAAYTYDNNDRKLTETVDYGAFSLSYSYTYDAAGNKASYTGPDAATVTYHWDKARLNRIALPGAGSINYASYRWNSPDKIVYPGGGSRSLSYDALQRPNSIVVTDPAGNPVMDYGYQYDVVGNITHKATDDLTYDYQYDELDRLIQSQSALETETWDYDANGNRLSDALNPGEWQYNENDELLVSPLGDYSYDASGSPQEKTVGAGVTNYQYNAENRLARVEDQAGGLIGEYVYDPLGRRIKKVTATGTTYFHYSDEGLVGEYDATGAPIRQYGYVPDSIWTMDPLYQKQDGEYAYYQNDHLGTPQRLMKGSGETVWSGRYRAFGEVVSRDVGWANPLRFPGQYEDGETGTFYNYFRYYDPATGRYITSDPIGLEGGLNTFAYVWGNPIRYYDPYGLWKMYGNWGGRNWAGGHSGTDIPGNPLPPVDSLDRCFMMHDYCYQAKEKRWEDRESSCSTDSGTSEEGEERICDLVLSQCMNNLPSNTRDWPEPPVGSPINPLTGEDFHNSTASHFLDMANMFFSHKWR